MKTLQQILNATKKAPRDGEFGLDACKDYIISYSLPAENGDLYALLGKYVERANKDVFFNPNMVQACWQLINDNDI